MNDGARELEAMIARTYKDQSPFVQTLGTSTAYTVTTQRTLTTHAEMGWMILVPHVDGAGGATTLQVNALTAKPLVRQDNTNPQIGDIKQHIPIIVIWSTGLDRYIAYGIQ